MCRLRTHHALLNAHIHRIKEEHQAKCESVSPPPPPVMRLFPITLPTVLENAVSSTKYTQHATLMHYTNQTDIFCFNGWIPHYSIQTHVLHLAGYSYSINSKEHLGTFQEHNNTLFILQNFPVTRCSLLNICSHIFVVEKLYSTYRRQPVSKSGPSSTTTVVMAITVATRVPVAGAQW